MGTAAAENGIVLGTCHQLLCTSHLPIPLCPMAFRHDAGYVPNKTSSNDQVQYLNSSPRTGSGSDGTPRDVVFETPRELTEEEIRAIEADFTPQQLAEFEEVEEALNSGFNADTLDKFGNTMLMIACQNGLKRIAKLVLRHGGSMNIGNKRGQTALHYCFQYGYEALGEYLITKGADPSVCNEFGLSCRQGTGR